MLDHQNEISNATSTPSGTHLVSSLILREKIGCICKLIKILQISSFFPFKIVQVFKLNSMFELYYLNRKKLKKIVKVDLNYDVVEK